MNAISRLSLSVLLCLALAGCGKDDSSVDQEAADSMQTPGGATVGPGSGGQIGTAAVAEQLPPETVLLTVNGAEITQGDFDEALAGMFGRAGLGNSPQFAAIKAQMMPRLEKQLVDRTLLQQAASEAGSTPTDEEVVAKFEELVKARLPKDADVDAELKRQGLTRDELYADIRKGMAIEKMVEGLPGVVNPTDEEVRAHYDANVLNYQTPERVKARHILIKLDRGATDEQKAEARKKIEGLLAQIKSGEGDFGKLAGEHSGCPSGAKGGDLGYFGRGQMVPPFEKAAFGLEVGGLSDVIETDFGFHIIKLDERQKAGTRPFDEVSASIKQQMQQQSRQRAVNTLLTDLKGKAEIKKTRAGEKAIATKPAPPPFPVQPGGAK